MFGILAIDVKPVLYRISLTIDSAIYGLIDSIYKIFLLLSGANLFSSDDMRALVERIYMVLGVVMLFIIAYSLLLSLINPDNITKGKQAPTKIIANLIITLVLIEMVPVIFDYASRVQSALLTNNTIGKIILGNETINGKTSANIISDGGSLVSSTIFQAFFHPASDYCRNIDEEALSSSNGCRKIEMYFDDNPQVPVSFGAVWQRVKDGDSIASLKSFSEEYGIGDESSDAIIYIPFVSSITGILTVWMLLTYCLALGVRAVKLAFYQLIAPIPIMSRLLPGDSQIFNKWIKATLATFVEVFIRIAILFFAVLIISLVTHKITNGDFGELFSAHTELLNHPNLRNFALVFIILGILTFVKQAPKLIGDLFGFDSSTMGLGDAWKAGAVGALVGGATGFIGGGIAAKKYGGSFFAGGAAGAIGGFQAKGNQWKAQANKQYQSLTGDYKGKVGYFGGKTLGTRLNNMAGKANDASKKKATTARKERAVEFKTAQREKEAYDKGLPVLDARIREFEKTDKYKEAYREASQDENTDAIITKTYNDFVAQNPNVVGDARSAAYQKIKERVRESQAIERLRKQNPNYQTDDTEVADYLRDLDLRKKVVSASFKDKKEYTRIKDEAAIKVDKMSKKVSKDAEITTALDKKKKNDEMVRSLQEALKQAGLDKKDDKKK